MNIDETLIQKCKQALFDARAYLDRAQMILDTMYADHAADDGKIDSEERAVITAQKSEESTGTSTNSTKAKIVTSPHCIMNYCAMGEAECVADKQHCPYDQRGKT